MVNVGKYTSPMEHLGIFLHFCRGLQNNEKMFLCFPGSRNLGVYSYCWMLPTHVYFLGCSPNEHML